MRAAIVVVLAVLLLSAVAFAVTQFQRPDPQLSTSPPRWQPYVEYAKHFTVALTSISYQDPDSSIERILDGSPVHSTTTLQKGGPTSNRRL